ncbi:methyltransferase domain-containing protein [Streptomyces sp. B6B3]|uniref:class I SAM-dependent methyltransferase n=1 Tax=Streptomyces sp. B6B3 TaxID=3153570 RepID=UPI00325C3F3B
MSPRSETRNAGQVTAGSPVTALDRAADADRYEVVSGGYDEALFAAAAIRPADRVLDVGCGYGGTTLRAARAAADGWAVGNDVVAAMLDQARATAADQGVTNVDFERGDAQTHPFPEAGFDVVISRMGTMFFADHLAAFRNLHRTLRPGGRLALAVLGDPADNDLTRVLAAALRPFLPPRLDDAGAPGVSSLARPDRIRDLLGAAGFGAISVTPLHVRIRIGGDTAEGAAFLADWGAVRDALPVDDSAAMDRARGALRAALDEVTEGAANGTGVRLRGAAWLVSARRPE